MNDLINSIKLFFYERATNPLITAFCFSWLIFNYQFVIIFFSGEDLITKFHFLSELYDAKSHFLIEKKWTIGLIYPLITASIYIFAFPYLTRYVIKFHYQKATELKNIKSIAEGETLVSNKKAREIQSRIYALEEEKEQTELRHKSEIKAFQEQIEAVTKDSEGRLEVMQTNLSDLTKENSELKTDLKNLRSTAAGLEAVKASAENNLAKLREQLNRSDVSNSYENARRAISSAINPSYKNNKIEDLFESSMSKSEQDLALLIISSLLHEPNRTMSKEEFYNLSKSGKSETGSMLSKLVSKNVIKHEKDSNGNYKYSLTEAGIAKLRKALANLA